MESAAPEERGHWWSVKRPQLALVLENKGSVARDHLALERTFLAWLRTSVSLVSAGIAITQLFKIPTLSSEPAVPDPDWEAVLASSIAHAAQSVDPLDQQHALQLILSTPSPVPAEAWSLERMYVPAPHLSISSHTLQRQALGRLFHRTGHCGDVVRHGAFLPGPSPADWRKVLAKPGRGVHQCRSCLHSPRIHF